MPSREDFANVYRLFLTSQRAGVNKLTHRDVCARISKLTGTELGYIKLKLMIMIFKELNLVSIQERFFCTLQYFTKISEWWSYCFKTELTRI